MMRFNEGKAVDAVLRRIEARENGVRRDVRFPEVEQHEAPIELACYVGKTLYALEHTSIEPFEEHVWFEAVAPKHFEPVKERLRELLPSAAALHLSVPAKATLGLKKNEIKRIQDTLVTEVIRLAPTLPEATPGRTGIPLRLEKLPFVAQLRRIGSKNARGLIGITHVLDGDLEKSRRDRIKRGYVEKVNKLRKWQALGAKAILILEENDIQLTNESLIADSIRKIERNRKQRPDEIHVVSSASRLNWSLTILRAGNHYYEDFSVLGESLQTDIDPNKLTDLTGR